MLRNASGDLKQLAKGILHVAKHGTPEKRPPVPERGHADSPGSGADDLWGDGRKASLRMWLEKAEQVLLSLPYDREMRPADRAQQTQRTKTRGRQRREKIFGYYDRDNDGVLSFAELIVLARDIHLEFQPDAPPLDLAELEAQVEEILQQIDIHQDHCVGRWNGTVEFDQFEPWLHDQELRYLQLQPRPRRSQTAAASQASPCLGLDALRSRMNLSRWRRITRAVAPTLAVRHESSAISPHRSASLLPRSRSHHNLEVAAAPVVKRDDGGLTQSSVSKLVRSVSLDNLLTEWRGASGPQDGTHSKAQLRHVHRQRNGSHSSSHVERMMSVSPRSPRLRYLQRDAAKALTRDAAKPVTQTIFRVGERVVTRDGFYAKIVSLQDCPSPHSQTVDQMLVLDVASVGRREGVHASLVTLCDSTEIGLYRNRTVAVSKAAKRCPEASVPSEGEGATAHVGHVRMGALSCPRAALPAQVPSDSTSQVLLPGSKVPVSHEGQATATSRGGVPGSRLVAGACVSACVFACVSAGPVPCLNLVRQVRCSLTVPCRFSKGVFGSCLHVCWEAV